MEGLEQPSPWLQPALLLYNAVLRAVPNLVAAGAAYGVLTVIGPADALRVVALAIISAHLIASVVKAVGTLVLAPYAPQLRLASITDENAAYCSVWWRRLVNIGAYGYVFCYAALLLRPARERPCGPDPPARYPAGRPSHHPDPAEPRGVRALAARDRADQRHAGAPPGLRLPGQARGFWHIPAILYVIAGGLLAAAEGLEGFLFLVKGSAATVAIAWATGFGFAGVRRGFERGFRIRAELHERYPGLQARVNRYLPVARRAAQTVILLLGLCLILEAWSADIFTWLASETGTAVIATLASIVAIALIATIVLEVATTLVDRYLTQVDDKGELVERSQRARTLLPLARNALRVVVGVIAVLMILSEIGLDIAPVLAGVGVAGLAIGFGAQTLVKDIITGLFILLEDSVAVGDVVTAGGHTGTVEAITIRTIRLRDLQGHVHTVPFSGVDTISNMTKEFSYYLIDMGVAYREDYDEVVDVMREVGAGLQQDPEFGPNMLEPLEIMGLNSFGDSAVIVRARLKTKPLTQWSTGREYNRRLKAAFDERGIEIPFPHTQIYFGEDKQGRAPAARVVVEDARADDDAPPQGSSFDDEEERESERSSVSARRVSGQATGRKTQAAAMARTRVRRR